ncbi:DinB family protein [Chitinophaga arvensicola]|uniref:DinB superfamily protein n=1 Tax=Chitinophaga arvensicola TaxID=29529 RepID=A0A1I0QF06_9BACT|nr:DinB family protein [Chitinophaga arvensicola]SEW25539.1 DinB superfamily protein [Chitinophaga arvensicola]
MKKNAIQPDPGYYTRYISLVPDLAIHAALEWSLNALNELDARALEPLGNYAYAEGKWTLKNVLEHITDTERIFSYRALLFARKDGQFPPTMEQDDYAANAEIDHRSVAEILAELKAVRSATITQFHNFSAAALLRTGMSWKTEMSVLALGFTIIGHQVHHFNILRERYFQHNSNMEVSS